LARDGAMQAPPCAVARRPIRIVSFHAPLRKILASSISLSIDQNNERRISNIVERGGCAMTLRLLQHRAADGKRSVIANDGESARFVNGVESTRELALQAITSGSGIDDMVSRLGLAQEVDPAAELAAARIIAPIDHADPAHLIMSGTGLTHLGSADARDRMHRAAATEKQTDSMRMFLDGVDRGKPTEGETGQIG